MSNTTKSASVSFPLFGVLGLIFVTLKLAEIGVVATWSWWWVLSPFWIPLAIVFAVLGIAGMIFGVAKLLGK